MGKYETLPEMLKSEGSKEYNDFIDNLGWKVTIEEHRGYLGNLNPSITGPHSRYYADANTEVMFHVATMMPNIEE